MTYSLIARDPATGDLGFGVQSHFFGVGRMVGRLQAGVGVVVTQAFAEVSFGPRALSLLHDGRSATETLNELLDPDPRRETRQLAIIDSSGTVATRTGSECVAESGHVVAPGVSAQGNMLASPEAWGSMLAAYDACGGTLAERILAALDAAEATGGDIRGRQSAAIRVVSGARSERPWEQDVVDVRVDDSPDPLPELRRLVGLNGFYNRLLAMFSEPGVLGGTDLPSADAVERALRDLRAGRELLGENPEATMWLGVLLARAGREDEARAHVREALDLRPELATYIRGFSDAAVIPDAALVERLLG